MAQQARLGTILSGVSGEYFVAAELSRRGCIASITLRNSRGVDILATTEDASHSVAIQVKTNQAGTKDWILHAKAEAEFAEKLFYVFVNLNGINGTPEYHVVPSGTVAEHCRRTHAEYLATPGRKGQKRKDSSMRKFDDAAGEYRGRWDLLGLGIERAQPRRLGVLGLTTFVNGLKNSLRLTPSAAKIAASASTVTPLSPRSSLPT